MLPGSVGAMEDDVVNDGFSPENNSVFDSLNNLLDRESLMVDRPRNYPFQSHIMNKNSRVKTVWEVVSKEELEMTVKTLLTLHQHRYLKTTEELLELNHAGTLYFQPLTDEEKRERRRNRRKEAKEKRKQHDEGLLDSTEMKKRKHQEIVHIKEQMQQLPSIANEQSDTPSITFQNESNASIIEELESNRKKVRHLECDFAKKAVPKKKDLLDLSSSEDFVISDVNDDLHDDNQEDDRFILKAKQCYVCKKKYEKVHFFYHKMCPECSEFNYMKRMQTCDLTGKIAFVTGGRVKIGYETVLKLLRNNATVIVTTRFPKDAAKRYIAESDFNVWKDRLQIYGLDLKHLPSVYAFTDFLKTKIPKLDILINNACQTLRRPCAYYKHVCVDELTTSYNDLDENLKRILPTDFHMGYDAIERKEAAINLLLAPTEISSIVDHSQSFQQGNGSLTTSIVPKSIESLRALSDVHNISTSSIVSQVPLLEEDTIYDHNLFPHGVTDVNKSQVDLRKKNSWIQLLDDVPVFEFLEVQTINVTAPFILTSRLKPLMMKEPNVDKFIINVSSMEGQFYRRSKKTTHPHLNMAKAGLNMMTRTSAADYAKDRIYMVSCDTGWNNDENPLDIENVKPTYFCPLDEIDGAARIVDPVFTCIKEDKKYFGLFLKNYQPYYW